MNDAIRPAAGSRWAVVALYSLTIFTSAALLFVVQPMFARMVLPLLGGSPAAWNTAMVFYQATLLAGYAYAHVGTAWLGVRRQALLHALVILAPLAVLPIVLPAGSAPPTEGNPSLWLVGLMTGVVGLPLFAISATSPLLQKWFSATGHPRAGDPYFLYVASNAGSLLALLAYPTCLEPHLRLAEQSEWWMLGYGLFVVLMAGCGVMLWRARPVDEVRPLAAGDVAGPTVTNRLRWVLLAFVPSSLLLGVTTYLSSEVAVVPLLWIAPLTLYLLTFILAFARRQLVTRTLLARLLPLLVVALVLVICMQATEPMGLLMLLHLLTFFVAAWLCHGELAAIRPPAKHLTEFYLWLSVGGVAGGIFNALVAPLVFNSLVEYPLVLVLACVVGLPRVSGGGARNWFWLLPWTGGTLALVLVARQWQGAHMAGLVFGLPALLGYFFSRHPLRFAMAMGGLLAAGTLWQGETGRPLSTERSFFGVNRVTLDPTGRFHLLLHGKTLHGRQHLDPARRMEPLTYYHRTGPIGQVLALHGQEPGASIAFVGLGAGSLASYARPGQTWTCYEIDPAVVRFAQDERYFTFLSGSTPKTRVVLGDARLSLMEEQSALFDLLIVDAYSSDAIPVHLVTREALAVYASRLAPQGLLAFHISNLHLDLEPVFANLARDAGFAGLVRDDTAISPEEEAAGKSPSIWLVMARRPEDLARLGLDPRWRLARGNDDPVWTDDYSSLLSVLRWR